MHTQAGSYTALQLQFKVADYIRVGGHHPVLPHGDTDNHEL